MNKSALFVEFDDSFSYNVCQELTDVGFSVRMLNWKDFDELPEEGLLVLGPGPGHPDDYQRIFPLIERWIKMNKPFFGVCLGHQIFWRILGENVVRARIPLHGQKIALKLDTEWSSWLKLDQPLFVQRYNSLCVPAQAQVRNPEYKNFIQDEEILITRGEHQLTYQFHPESMGTTFRQAFFLPLLGV
jgi:anthranilate/para-aminobenzoate synthase component II